MILPSTDEFGGYSSRLRLHETLIMEDSDYGLESSLCALLGIDIESKALEIVMEDKKKGDLSQNLS